MNWMKRSLFTKLLIGVLAATAIPILISNIVGYRSSSIAVKKQIIELNLHAMSIGIDNLETYFSDLSEAAVSYYDNPDLMGYIENPEAAPYDQLLLDRKLNQIYASHLELRGVNFQSAVTGRNYTLNYNVNDLELLGPEAIPKSESDWEMTTGFRISSIGNVKVLMLSRPLIDYPGTKVLGVTTLYVGLSKIAETVRGITDPSQNVSDFFYIHDSPQLLYSSESASDMTEVAGLAARIQEQSGYRSGTWNEQPGVFIYMTDTFRQMPIELIRFVPESTINKAADHTLGSSLIMQAIAAVFVISLVALLSLYITRRIKRIIQSIAKVEIGNFKEEKLLGASDELGVLERRFHNMVQRLDIMINQEYRTKLELSNAQLKMLQSQINPHFLYNTLQSIGTLALSRGVTEISDKIAELGELFRYSMDTKTEIVPIRTELRHIENYLSLQGGRFVKKLTYNISCPDELMEVTVPKMILQPLVENSIVHGVEKGRGSGMVHVLVEQGDGIRIRIIDNGKGMDAHKIEWLEQRYAENQLNSDSSIGLLNVLRRLRLYYGSGFEWSIQSEPYAMTVVTLLIPDQPQE